MKKTVLLLFAMAVVLFSNPILSTAQEGIDREALTPKYRELNQNQVREVITYGQSRADTIDVTQNNNINDLIDAFLVDSSGIFVTDIQLTSHPDATGLYTGGPFNIDDGIILATGKAVDAEPPDDSPSKSTDLDEPGCVLCDSLSDGYTTYDAVILEITFDAAVVCSTIAFDFVFGSEEFPEYVGTQYNDVFGVYLNGDQIAYDEFGNPITINGGFFDSTGYVQTPPTNGLQYDGSTLRLKTQAQIVPGSLNNTLTFVICDASDHVWDSGVLLANLEGSGDIPPCTGVAPEFIHPPTPTCGDTVFVHANQLLTFDVEVFDPGPNNDTVTLTSGTLPTGASMSPALPQVGNPVTTTFSWTPTSADAGVHQVTFYAEDAELDSCQLTDQCKIYIKVCPEGPTCNLPSDQTVFVCGDTTLSFPVSASDADGNPVDCQLTSGVGSLAGGQWSFAVSGAGVYSASFECTDECGGTCNGTVNITVETNSPPVCNVPDDQAVFVCGDSTFNYTIGGSDPDGNFNGCTMLSGPGSFDGTTWSFTSSGEGVYSAIFECSDDCGETCTDTLNVDIDYNETPVCDLPDNQSFFICDDTTFSFPVGASDADGNLQSCVLTSGDGTFDGSNWNFISDGSGVYSATFECVDSCGESCTGTVEITVTKNSAPVCTLPEDQTFFVCGDTTFNFAVTASDDDDNLIECIKTSGAGSFDGATWSFTTSGPGVYTGSFECEDACGEICSGSVSITVNYNSAPVCNLPSDQSFFICDDTTFSFPVSATDADGNLIDCQITSGVGSIVDGNWVFTTSGSGVYSASFECADECGAVCSGSVSITVTKNSQPVCDLPDNQSFFICDDTTFSFPVSASDPDGNLSGCTLVSGPGSFDGSNWVFDATASGVYTGVFECTDNCGEVCGGTVEITVTKNSAPVCSLPSDQTYFLCADSTFSFPVSATDSDGNLVGCNLISGDGSFDGSNWSFTTSGPGTYSATFECTDECGAVCGGTVSITIESNSAPVCNLPDDQTFFVCGDTTFSFPVSATDSDGNLAGCNLISGDGSFDGSNWSFTTSGPGTYSATFECEDECGEVCGGTVTMTVEENSAPSCNLPADQSFFVCGDTTFSFPVSATDSDGNLVGCNLISGDGSFDGSNWNFTTSGPGTYSATFECEDECGEVCGGTVTMTVGYNSAPVCNLPSDQNFFICDDTTFSFPVSATDSDGNLVECSLVSGDGYLDNGNWIFSATATGTYSASFECIDECGATCSGTVNIDITRNTDPVCILPPDTSFLVGGDTTFSFPVSATDIDGNLSGCVKLSGDGSFDGSNWTFSTTGSDVYSATFECTDDCGASCSGTVSIVVSSNSAPTCNLPSNQNFFVCEDTTFNFVVSASDVDGNLVGCTQTSGVGSLTDSIWTFTTSGSGVYTATFECEDEFGEICGGTVSITVTKNSQPVCELPDDQSYFICGDTTFSFPVSATDIDNNLVDCQMISGDGSFDGSTWSFDASGSGTYSATFECTDECGETCSGTVTITTTANSAPACNLPADQSFFVCSDTTFTFPVSANDVDGNLSGCSMTSGPGSFDGSNWVFTTSGPGVYTAEFECVDECGATCSGTVNITVTENSAPVCELPPDQSFFVCDDTLFNFNVSATDTDGNLTGCSLISGDGTFDGSVWTLQTNGSGTYSATFECVDECGATCQGTVTIEVTKNSQPVCTLPTDQTFFVCGDTTFNFVVTSTDDDDNLVGCSMTSGPGSFDGTNWSFTTSGPGDYVASFECEDECGEICGGTVTITIEENNAPVCSIPADQTVFICNDTTLSFPVSATDSDGNLVGCTMSSGIGSFDGALWTFEATVPGDYIATFVCEDECGATCQGTVTITIERNSAPVCELPEDQSIFICADTTLNFAISASDVDDNLTGCSKKSGAGTFDGSNWSFTATSPGIYSAVFECVDECGARCTDTVNITITRNSAPICDLPNDNSFFVCGDTTFNFPVSASDNDGNLVECRLVNGVGTLADGIWTFTTTAPGSYTAEFECEDECGAVCGGSVTMTVEYNSAPICSLPADTSFFINSDTTLSFTVSASDVDDNLVGCTKLSGPGSFDGTTWTFTTAGEGVYTAEFECADQCGVTCGGTVNVTVGFNSAPQCALPASDTFFVCADSTFSFPVSATDLDDNLVGCSQTDGVGAFDGTNWTFTTSGEGLYTGSFECVDELGLTCGGTVEIFVVYNSDPALVLPADETVAICDDSTFVYPVSATDLDGNLMEVRLVGGSGSFDGVNWTFTATQEKTYYGEFEAEDTCGAVVSGEVAITVEYNSSAPVCIVPNDTIISQCEPSQVNLPVSATDDDGNLAGCELLSGPGTLSGGFWTYTPSGDTTVQVEIKCSDECGLFCVDTFEVTFELNNWAIIMLDFSGSMNIPNQEGETRFVRAKQTAREEIRMLLNPADTMYTGCYQVAIMYFNSSLGVVRYESFTSDSTVLFSALDSLKGPRHDTPLASGICEAQCLLDIFSGEEKLLFMYTNGLENYSTDFDMCTLCEPCDSLQFTGWNYGCDPLLDTGDCTPWQLCLYEQYIINSTNIVHYYDGPQDPFSKDLKYFEDLMFLKAIADESDGRFYYHSDDYLDEILCGDANNDWSVDVSDAVHIINYAFAGGTPPDPYVSGDANCDGSVDVSDAVYIIAYAFAGGNAPCDTDGDGIPDC